MDAECWVPPFFCFTITLGRTATQTQDLITSFRWEQMDHLLYSPDLAPSDFHLFLHLKQFLGGKRFNDNIDLKDAVQKWLTSQAAAFYEEGIQKLVQKHYRSWNVRVISQQPLHEMTGRFVVQLPWKSHHEGLGRSYDQALYGFQQLEKQL